MAFLPFDASSTATEVVKKLLLPRAHDHSNFTPSEMAEMLVDPYEDTPKCALRPFSRRASVV